MRICTLLLTAAFMLPGCSAMDNRADQKQRWLASSRKGCEATASVLKKLRRAVSAFEKTYEEELDKTKKNRRPLQIYNPQLLSRLEARLGPLDTGKGPLANRLAREVWPSHYRFVKNADEVLPRLHRVLVALAELRSTVSMARRLEQRYGKILATKTALRKKHSPVQILKYGVRIKSDRVVEFLDKLPPAPLRAKGQPSDCAPFLGTVRAFRPQDVELINRIECRGRRKIVYTAHLYHLMQIKLILARLKKLNLRGLIIAFRRSAE